MPDGTRLSPKNGHFSFSTSAAIVGGLARHGFRLQKALSGPDKGELAEFSFLDTIGQKTLYSTNFALSWQPVKTKNSGHTNIRLQTSVEGNLASDESESEDAWRFRLSSIFVSSFIRCRDAGCDEFTDPTFSSFYTSASLKYEGDRDFNTKKLSGEFVTTPNSRRLAIGDAYPNNVRNPPVQIQWRPLFGLTAGHTFRKGNSAETNSTILRLAPRVRTVINLHFLRRALNMDDVNIFGDYTFFYLPLENQRKNNNFFNSGVQFRFTPNLGAGLTYTTGRSAPEFQKINTLKAVIGISFGNSE